MFAKFLENHRTEILELAEEKTLKLAGPLPSSEKLRRGLPIFFEHLIEYLRSSAAGLLEKKIVLGASDHGKELMRLNYTLSHVVHSYGAICQAVTEVAQRKKINISPNEFNELNLCLDIAIAAAVSEFQFISVQAIEEREVQHLGFLVHELRNALSSATVAHEMITQGLVGTGGSTARVLKESFIRMRNLMDRSLSEIRMRSDPTVHIEEFRLNVLLDQILLTAQSEAQAKKQTLASDVNSEIVLETDRQLLLSAIANIIQNALKYSKVGGHISIRAATSANNVVIEIEDEGGGIEPEALRNLLKPFVSGGFDQSGLGLGLTIVQRAIFLLQGKISVRNHPGVGCVFLLEVPKKILPMPAARTSSGEDSAQPTSNKK